MRQESKKEFSGQGTLETINAGSLQRIADATDKMAQDYLQLERDRDFYKSRFEAEKAETKRLSRSNNALRGLVRRLKGQLGKAAQ